MEIRHYIVMYAGLTGDNMGWRPCEEIFETLAQAEQATRPYGQWQILEIVNRVIRTSDNVIQT